jgi:superfamily II DNA or RNA helicase
MVPAALREQWRRELLEKFGLTCLLADRITIDAAVQAGRFGDNPWHRPGVWLASADYLRQTHVRDALPFIPWDVLVIDEAHTVCGDSERHAVSHDMARRARHVVLLSATPHSGDDRRFGRLEDLGALPELADELVLFRRTRAAVAAHLTRRVHWRRLVLSSAERRLLDTLAAFEQAVVRAAGDARAADALLLLSIFRKRALSSTHALGISVDRRLAWIDRSERRAPLDWLQPSFSFDDRPLPEGDDDCEGLTRESGLEAARERTWLRRLRVLAAEAARTETKLARLCRAAMRTTEPIVVFTEFRHTLERIGQALGRLRDVSLLHGGMTEAEREAALRDFQQGRTSALVATDVASQGLNLQDRARWVVIFELPWNPARLEQRVGRVDRLGQTRRVHATLLTAAHSMEAGILSRMAARAVHANEVLGGGMFDGFAPDTAVMRAILRGIHDLEPGPVAPTIRQPSCRWRRTARAAAWCLRRRRLLNQAWRAPVQAGSRYLRCDASTAVRGESTALAVWTIPIVDAAGITVERQLLAANVQEPAPDDPRRWLPAAERLSRGRLAARARRLDRLAARRARLGCAVERAIGTYLVTQQFPEFFQPELFHDRMVRAAAAGARHREDITQTAGSRLREWEARGSVAIGRPSLEILAGRR